MKGIEEQFKAIYDACPDTIMLLDEHGFLDCNPATLEMFACSTKEEFIGRHPSEYSPPTQSDGRDSMEAANEKISTAYKTGSNLFEWTHQRANGEIFTAEVQLTLLKLKDGDILQATVRDITKRKKTEKANASYVRRLEGMQKITDAITSSLIPEEMLDNVITAIREIFKSDRAWLLQPCDPEADYFTVPVESNLPEYPGAFTLNQKVPIRDEGKQIIIDALDSLQAVTYCPMPKGGDTREEFAVLSQMVMAIKPRYGKPWLLGMHQCSFERIWTDEEKELFQNIGSRMSDVLSAAYLHQQLREKGSRFHTIIDNVPDIICVADINSGYFTESNLAVTKILGFSVEEFTSRPLEEFIHPDDRQRTTDEIANQLKGASTAKFENRYQCKDGSYKWLSWDVTAVDIKGTVYAVATNISEHKQLEEQLRQSQKMEAIGTLVGGIAHDFNNMLGGITGNLYLAKREVKDHPSAVDNLNSIEKLSFRAADMIQQLLTFARKGMIKKEHVSLTSFLKEASKLSEAAIPESTNVTDNFCDKDLIINADATQLHQVLLNLLSNAQDAVADISEPQIDICLDEFEADDAFMTSHPEASSKYYAHLSISDNGIGIREEDMDHILDPFYTTKEVGKGTGLGLSMVYGAVQSHEGILDIESTENQGTAVHIYLPLVAEEEHPIMTTGQEAVIEEGKGETILLVDDETMLLEMGKKVLESLGYHVLTAQNGLEAVDIFSSNKKVALVIMDVVMPKMGGAEAVRLIRKCNPDVPVIFATGYDKEEALKADDRFERSLVMNKPLHIEELSQRIKEII